MIRLIRRLSHWRHEDAFLGNARFDTGCVDCGGDLYDFFMIDTRRLCFMVGDVGGKGVLASLFMAIAKALAKSIASCVDQGLGVITSLTNQQLSRENAEQLSVNLHRYS